MIEVNNNEMKEYPMKIEKRTVGESYLKPVHSKGRHYLYLARKENGVVKYKFSFGHMETALTTMLEWRDKEKIPQGLILLGYTYEELLKWIWTIETGYTEKGKKLEWLFNWKEEKQSEALRKIKNSSSR